MVSTPPIDVFRLPEFHDDDPNKSGPDNILSVQDFEVLFSNTNPEYNALRAWIGTTNPNRALQRTARLFRPLEITAARRSRVSIKLDRVKLYRKRYLARFKKLGQGGYVSENEFSELQKDLKLWYKFDHKTVTTKYKYQQHLVVILGLQHAELRKLPSYTQLYEEGKSIAQKLATAENFSPESESISLPKPAQQKPLAIPRNILQAATRNHWIALLRNNHLFYSEAPEVYLAIARQASRDRFNISGNSTDKKIVAHAFIEIREVEKGRRFLPAYEFPYGSAMKKFWSEVDKKKLQSLSLRTYRTQSNRIRPLSDIIFLNPEFGNADGTLTQTIWNTYAASATTILNNSSSPNPLSSAQLKQETNLPIRAQLHFMGELLRYDPLIPVVTPPLILPHYKLNNDALKAAFSPAMRNKVDGDVARVRADLGLTGRSPIYFITCRPGPSEKSAYYPVGLSLIVVDPEGQGEDADDLPADHETIRHEGVHFILDRLFLDSKHPFAVHLEEGIAMRFEGLNRSILADELLQHRGMYDFERIRNNGFYRAKADPKQEVTTEENITENRWCKCENKKNENGGSGTTSKVSKGRKVKLKEEIRKENSHYNLGALFWEVIAHRVGDEGIRNILARLKELKKNKSNFSEHSRIIINDVFSRMTGKSVEEWMRLSIKGLQEWKPPVSDLPMFAKYTDIGPISLKKS